MNPKYSFTIVWIGLVVFTACSPPGLQAVQDSSPEPLCERFRKVQSDPGFPEGIDSPMRVAVEAGHICLGEFLEWIDPEQPEELRQRGAHFLAFVDHPDAADTLRHFATTRDEFWLPAIRSASDRGDAGDVRFLEEVLARTPRGTPETNFRRLLATMALGITRDGRAREVLRREAETGSRHAEAALRVLDQPPMVVRGPGIDEDAAMALVLDSRGERGSLYEPDRNRVWHRAGREWHVRSAAGDDRELPAVGVEVERSADGRAAIVAFSIERGETVPEYGYIGTVRGYGYLLRLDDRRGGWRVAQGWYRWNQSIRE